MARLSNPATDTKIIIDKIGMRIYTFRPPVKVIKETWEGRERYVSWARIRNYGARESSIVH